MRWSAVLAVLAVSASVDASPQTSPLTIRCMDLATAELAIDGLLDDWPRPVVARAGQRGDGALVLRCAWDGEALALSLDVEDDRVVRLPRGGGQEDHVTISVAAGGRPVAIDVYPGNAIAKSRRTSPKKVATADSLQPKGFSVESRIPAAQVPGLSSSTPSLDLRIAFHDADRAAGRDMTTYDFTATVELGDRKDLLDELLRTTRLRRRDITLDTLAELDPDRRGAERLVAGGTVIAVLTDQFAYVTLPAARVADVRKVELLPLGRGTQRVIAAVVRQGGNGGSRDLLMLWTVWSGQLSPLAQIEIRKELGGNVLEASWRAVRGKRGSELWVEPKPAIGWTEQSWNEVPADDADPIVLPWDASKGGVAYALRGAEVERRDLPRKKKR